MTLGSARGQRGLQGGMDRQRRIPDCSPLIEVVEKRTWPISGLRLGGPGPEVRPRTWPTSPRSATCDGRQIGNGDYYRFPASAEPVSIYAGLEVDNCEIGGWSHAGAPHGHAAHPAARVTTHVRHCNIHHCQADGPPYRVSVGDACEALVEANLLTIPGMRSLAPGALQLL